MRTWVVATIAGILLGVVYALSPATAWFGVAMWALHRYATSGFDADERRWLTGILVFAVALRVIAVAGLFLTTNYAQTPFGIGLELSAEDLLGEKAFQKAKHESGGVGGRLFACAGPRKSPR